MLAYHRMSSLTHDSWQCALTKLGYLLSKPELSVAQVRSLVGTSLRGEVTLPTANLPKSVSGPEGIEDSLETIQGVLSQLVRLSTLRQKVPQVVVSSTSGETKASDESTAPWSWTAAEAAFTEAALLPYLIHLSAARDDLEGVKFCLRESESAETKNEATGSKSGAIIGGVANCIDPASGRSPLHVAALNGSIHCVNALLEAGALVHLRDSLGHTPLYYVGLVISLIATRSDKLLVKAARQGHEDVVDLLVKIGANLGGSDIEGGFTSLITHKANHTHDERALRIWSKAGAHLSDSGHAELN